MIITQTRQRRTFVGSLNLGEDLIESLRHICVDNSILCAFWSGIGYVENPQLRTFNLERKDYDRVVEHEGLLHVVALHGNVSLRDRKTVIRGHVIGMLHREDEEATLLSGEIMGGDVVSFEFTLSSVDDIRLYRAKDDRTGLEPWLHMDLGGGPLPDLSEEDVRRPPTATTAPAGDDSDDEDDEDVTTADVGMGDWLEHPTLGRCQVVGGDVEERATIKLSSGRNVELHLGLLNLEQIGKADDGKKLFKVSIKRRR